MSELDLDQRLAAMRAELKSEGFQQKQRSGEPWAYSEQLDEPVIPAVTLRTFLIRRMRRRVRSS
jgi:hypothetical protein